MAVRVEWMPQDELQRLSEAREMDTLVREVQSRHQRLAPVDIVTPMNKVLFECREGIYRMGRPGQAWNLSERAIRQMCQRIGMDSKYFFKHNLETPTEMAMLFQGVNYWLQKCNYSPLNGLIRTANLGEPTVRAILTESFRPFDDIDLLPIVADVLADEPDLHIDFARFDADFTHIRLVFPKYSFEVKEGDVVQMGLHLSNSEVGMRAIHIDSILYRLVCRNGLIRNVPGDKVSISHRADPSTVKDYVYTTLQNAKPAVRIMFDQFKESLTLRPSHPEKVIQLAGKDMTDDQFERTMKEFLTVGDNTMFGVINSITAAAQLEETAEARYQMERIGGKLLAEVGR